MIETLYEKFGVIVINDFFNQAECHAFIEMSERHGYETAKIKTAFGEQESEEVRNNQRIVFDDFDLAKNIFEKAKSYLPEEINYWKPIALNERFRFYKYDSSQYFKWHVDGIYVKNYYESSKLTILIYLNDDYQGGETEFEQFKVSPKAGMAVIFPHKLRHQSTPIIEGIKYVLRSDVMYAKA